MIKEKNMSRHYFVVTGVDLKRKLIRTRTYDDVEAVAGVLETFDPEVAQSANDINIEAQTRASHGSAMILEGKNYFWSIYYV